jgi:hypothetical protein
VYQIEESMCLALEVSDEYLVDQRAKLCEKHGADHKLCLQKYLPKTRDELDVGFDNRLLEYSLYPCNQKE